MSDNTRPHCRKVVVLGATGSIGTSSQKVARAIPERMQIIGLAAQRNVSEMVTAIDEFGIAEAAMFDSAAAAELQLHFPGKSIYQGEEGLVRLATLPEADLVIIAIVGTAGLRPALAALEAGKDIAVASKEILVMAGEIVMATAAKHGRLVLPVDSEHNAIFQCLEGRNPATVQRIILTASGGPFREWPAEQIPTATLAQALKHPTWTMGQKITIDSASLFNKGLEMIEARWLFGVPMEQVDVVVHPQSIVHSMVEFVDGSVLAQLSHSDMCFPIQYAVTWPDRVSSGLRPLDFASVGQLTFQAPRLDCFPALDLARRAGTEGGTLPAVLNAANEVAVEAFVAGKLGFSGIWGTVAAVMEAHENTPHAKLEEILAADSWARQAAAEHIARA
jgi:1-deoxy-D-xylulose-5-phosphate reductoisomerase